MTTRAQVTVAAQGTQGPPGLRWMGVYDPTAAYTVRDLVRDDDNNILYIVVTDVPANSNFLLTNETYFDVFAIQVVRSPGMQWRGTYDANQDYAPKDLVREASTNNVYYLNVSVARNSNPDFTDSAVADLVLQGLEVSDADIQSLNTLAPYSSYLQTLAGISADISTVGGIAANVTTVAGSNADVSTVATNLGQGAASEIVLVGDNITDVVTVAAQVNNNASALNTAVTNATNAANSAAAAATSETNAGTSATNAAASETAADNAYNDAKKLAVNAHNSQYTLTDTSTGYSALHYATEASNSLSAVNDKFLGSYTTANLPSSNVTTGAIAYDSTVSRLKIWDGSQWLLGLEGDQGPSGPGITAVNYDSATDTLSITYDAPGTSIAEDPRIGTEDINFGPYVIKYSNSFALVADLPSATSYPGMFAVANGVPHFSSGGSWYAITYNNTPVLSN